MPGGASASLLAGHGPLIARLHEQACGARWGLSVERFGTALARSCERRFRAAPPGSVAPREIAAYLESLHVADLALACACADGSERAWDEFMGKFRPDLYAAARAIAGDAASRELADSLYADLYGVEERDGRRKPLFDYFHGRSKLSTWLRSVLAQRHVDRLRAARRTRSLDSEDAGAPAGSRAANLVSTDASPEPDRPQLARLFQQAVTQAVASLASADRLRLSYYYLHALTLSEIGRLMGEHESSVSRKLERARRALRDDIERRLLGQGLERDDVRQCYERATQDGQWDLAELLKT
jgi:RNA polymerase sigma-70 factor (ECF subfamily)